MTCSSMVFDGDVYEDTPAYLLARITAVGGSGAASPVSTEELLIQQADVGTISVHAFASDGTQNGSTDTPAAANTVFDTLQTARSWALLTGGGGNFRYKCPATFFPLGGDTVTVEVTITLTDSTPIRGIWQVYVQGLVQS